MLALVDMIRNENNMYINMGRKEGRKEGKKQNCIEIAQKLLKIKMPISQISEVTTLTKEEIEKIKKKKTKYKFFQKILVLFLIYIYNKQQKKWR